jgi:general stress protein YciG
MKGGLMPDQGFASMDQPKRKNIASKGGSARGTNKSNSQRSEAGKKGAAAQSTDDKAKGGRRGH